MTTTINMSDKGQVELPKEFRERRKIKPGTPLRVTEVARGFTSRPSRSRRKRN